MLVINARNILVYSTEVLWNNLENDFELRFDNGDVVQTNEKEVIYSSYAWEMIRRYPETPFTKFHHVKEVMGDKRMGSGTHLKLIGNVLFDVYNTYSNLVPDKVSLLDDLCKMAYQIVNQMYNDLTYRLEEYVTSIDILDFLEVTENPILVKAMEDIEPTQDGIDHVYEIIKDLIKNEVSLKDNPLVKAAQSGIVDQNQVLQCVGPRGFLTDMDSHIFKKPILRGFVHGLRSLSDGMSETRSAAKALAFSTDPLQQSEYFSRRQQLITMNVQNLHRGDCGSQHYLSWHVRGPKPKVMEEDIVLADIADQVIDEGANNDDLKTIAGKYYLDEETNTLKAIKKTDTHLIGKTIKIRSIVAGCNHPDPYGVCEICFGEASLAVPANTNLGHMACVATTEKISQNVLSTKHHDGSSVVEGIILKPFEKKYLHAPVNGSMYFLNDELIKNKSVQLVIDSSSAMGLTDINLVADVTTLNISRISEFSMIELVVTDKRGTESIPIDVCVNKRYANMTHALLKHVKEKGWTITKEGKYVIDMAGWDAKNPILSLPMRHFNMGD